MKPWAIFIFILFMAMLQPTRLIHAQQSKLIGAATPKGIVLVWRLPKKYKNTPLLIYRKRPDRAKRRLLTETPLQRATSTSDIKERLGKETLAAMRPSKDKGFSEDEIIKMIQADSDYIDLAALYYPKLGEALALRYFDKLVVKSKTYTYWLVAKVGEREITLAKTRVNSSNIPRVLKPDKLKGKMADGLTALEWQPVRDPNVIGYHVYRNEHEDEDFTRITKVPLAYLEPAETKVPVVYNDVTIEAKKTYWYQVVAVHFSGVESEPSDRIKLKDATQPKAPIILSAKLQRDGRIILSWRKPVEKSIAYFDIFRANGREAEFKKINPVPVAKNTTRYIDRLGPNTGFYWYKIRITNKKNIRSDFSNAISCRLRKLVKPKAIMNIKVTVSSRQITLKWPRVSDKSIRHYVVERAENLNENFFEQKRTKNNEYTDTKVSPGQTYYYRIWYDDTSGNHSLPSKTVTVATIDNRPPLEPVLFRAVFIKTEARLSWQPVHTTQLAGYQILIKTNVDLRFRTLINIKNQKTTTFRYRVPDNILQATFRIYAISKNGRKSRKFAESKARVRLDVLPAVKMNMVQLRRYKGQQVIAIYWQRLAHPRLLGYHVYRKEVGKKQFQKINYKTIKGNQQFYFDTSANTAKRYSYYLVSIDRQGKEGRKSRILIYDGE